MGLRPTEAPETLRVSEVPWCVLRPSGSPRSPWCVLRPSGSPDSPAGNQSSFPRCCPPAGGRAHGPEGHGGSGGPRHPGVPPPPPYPYPVPIYPYPGTHLAEHRLRTGYTLYTAAAQRPRAVSRASSGGLAVPGSPGECRTAVGGQEPQRGSASNNRCCGLRARGLSGHVF